MAYRKSYIADFEAAVFGLNRELKPKESSKIKVIASLLCTKSETVLKKKTESKQSENKGKSSSYGVYK